MRYLGYFRMSLVTGETDRLDFNNSHFAEVGMRSQSIGMPQLEALELVNKWNRSESWAGLETRFIFWV